MDRCKLEYMIKNADFKAKKEIIYEMDPYGDYFFGKDCSNFLLDINGPNVFYYHPEFQYLPEMKDELIEEAIKKYKYINELCINNKIYPFFKDPTNVEECERIRLDIVKIMPEEMINKFFGVDHIRWYEPPIYECE